jgi:ankyrin repeat protein
MAYIGNTARLCQAIVDKDIEGVADWFESEELEQVDVNRRDHAGRTPLILATMCSTPEIVDFLIERGARLVSRMYNGMTALHVAAYRGELKMIKALLDRSKINEQQEEEKEESRRAARRAAAKAAKPIDPESESDDSGEDISDVDDEAPDAVTEGSFINISGQEKGMQVEDNEDDPDVYDVDVLAWDNPLSPLHLAIIAGHVDAIQLLCEEYAADVLLPVKILSQYDRTPESAILTLILALNQPLENSKKTVAALLSQGATATQADMKQVSALHYAINEAKVVILDMLKQGLDSTALAKAMNILGPYNPNHYWQSAYAYPLATAICKRNLDMVESVLDMGAEPEITLDRFSTTYKRDNKYASSDPDQIKKDFQEKTEQPIILAAKMEMPEVVSRLIQLGADVNTLPRGGYMYLHGNRWNSDDKSLLDIVDERIKALRKSLGGKEEEKLEAPHTLKPDSSYLQFKSGSYQSWFAEYDLEHAKHVIAHQKAEYEKEGKEDNPPQPRFLEGKRMKREATEGMIQKYEALRAELKKKGAKSFRGMSSKVVDFLVWCSQSTFLIGLFLRIVDCTSKKVRDRLSWSFPHFL